MRAALTLVLFMCACEPNEPLGLPAPPREAGSVLIVALAGETPQTLGFDRNSDGTFHALPIRSSPPELWAVLFLAGDLRSHALEPGPIPDGRMLPGARPLPPALASYERRGDEDWTAVDELEPHLVALRLPDVSDEDCDNASGCREVASDPQQCLIPCPCPRTMPETDPLPLIEGCRPPAPAREQDRWRYKKEVQISSSSTGVAIDQVGSIVIEAGRSWLYYSALIGDPAIPAMRVYRVQLDGDGEPEKASIEPLPLFPELEPWIGFVLRPVVRPDGLEMTLQVATDSDIYDYDIYHALRARVTDPWPPARLIRSLDRDTYKLLNPLLLADYRTLLYQTPDDLVHRAAARRETTRAEDEGFVLESNGLSNERARVHAYASGGDRGHVIAARIDRDSDKKHHLQMVRIHTLEPLSFEDPFELLLEDEEPILYEGNDQLPPAEFTRDLSIVESPDCRFLYVSDDHGTRLYERTVASGACVRP